MYFRALASFTKSDDRWSNRTITKFLELLQTEVRILLGSENFHILPEFKSDITDEESGMSVSDIHLLLPILTPAWFNNVDCQKHFKAFFDRETSIGRNDLIVPILFTDCYGLGKKRMGEPQKTERSEVQILSNRYIVDFSEFQHGGLFESDGQVKKSALFAIIRLAESITSALEIYKDQSRSPIGAINNQTFEIPDTKIINFEPEVIYQERMLHFLREKKFLANRFGDYLLARIEHLSKKNPIILYVDSGTTLFHLFTKLGSSAKEARNDGRWTSWINNLVIVTNNLTGIRWLMREAREENDKMADLLLKCVALPGGPHPAFSATIGFSDQCRRPIDELLNSLDTHRVIDDVRAKLNRLRTNGTSQVPKVITITTGNWVRIRFASPRVPLVLTRGEYQIQFKQALIDSADEVYVLAPLGKIFAGSWKDGVYPTLDNYCNRKRSRSSTYDEVNYYNREQEDISRRIRLVTTSRKPGRILAPLSNKLANHEFMDCLQIREEEYVNRQYPFKRSPIENVSHLMFEFDQLPDNLEEEFKIEFPHRESHFREFLECFHLSSDVLSGIDHLLTG